MDVAPPNMHAAIKKCPELKLRKVMDLMRDRLRYPSDMNAHPYFFVDPDLLDSGIEMVNKAFNKNLSQTDKVALTTTLTERLSKINSVSFNSGTVNKAVSVILYEMSKEAKWVKNEDVFRVLRLAATGSASVCNVPIGDICEILGKEVIIKRLGNVKEMLSDDIKVLGIA